MRKKPVEVSNFIADMANFEHRHGTLRKINSLNRVRFKILNDVDSVINKEVKAINE